jgi:hypothetical protein
MDWLEGESVADRLRAGPLSVAATATIGARVASALAHAHAAHVLHRDIKPSNIILVGGAPERATLIDFGVAKDQLATSLTHTGQLVGTPSYMAPEQAKGTALDRRVDLFALGCLLYELLTGKPAFEGTELIEVIAQVLVREPPPIGDVRDDVPPRLDAVVRALLEKDPERRIGDTALVAAELAAIEAALAANDDAALATVAEPFRAHAATERETVLERPRRRARAWLVLAGAGAVVVAGVVGISLATRSTAPQPELDAGRALHGEDCMGSAREGCVARCTSGEALACEDLGDGTPLTDRSGLEFFERACELGHARGCMRAGSRMQALAHREPGAFQRAEWERLLERGCDLDDSTACSVLATSLLRNEPRDPARAKQLFEKGCARGFKSACAQAQQLK